jgi:hypothetical protein
MDLSPNKQGRRWGSKHRKQSGVGGNAANKHLKLWGATWLLGRKGWLEPRCSFDVQTVHDLQWFNSGMFYFLVKVIGIQLKAHFEFQISHPKAPCITSTLPLSSIFLYSLYRWNHVIFVFWCRLISLGIMSSRFIHVVTKDRVPF